MTFNATALAHEMRATREAFGYEYRRVDYNETWRHAPWVRGSMAAMGSCLRDAALRDVAFRMPCHDHPPRRT